jgi:type II secretory pathway predicted ATPase ExeA
MSEPTIGELHGLDATDPWDRRTPLQKTRDALRREIQELAAQLPRPAIAFVDPADDEDQRIDASKHLYHRLMISGQKLAAILRAEPSLVDLGIAARNTAAGCWIALTSQRIAQRLLNDLTTRGFVIALQLVDADGNLAAYTLLSDQQHESIEQSLSGTKT